ncbi:MAG TPA: L,D-transpeptidase family protein, partial [Aestuariivirga sp.]
DKTVWQSRVIVGQPTKQTYAFFDKIQTVVFNPKCGVPASIIINEYGPKMRKDPGYLDRNGFIVVDQAGNQIDSQSVDWFNIGPNPKFGLQQLAGGENALGELKFLFPNVHDIYMHDTPTKPLFKTAERAYSHGCVRVQNPREFAQVLLGWSKEQVANGIELNRDTHSVQLPQKVPVYLTYFTAWTDDNGQLTFMNDVYQRDAAIIKAMGYDPNARKSSQPAVAQGAVSGGIIQN